MECRNIEGWRAVSSQRDFDWTPCFEEGVLVAGTLAAVGLLAVLKTLLLCVQTPQSISRTSTLYLRAKTVRPFTSLVNSADFAR